MIRKLSIGGMGEVYLAEQVRLGGRRVALKVLRPVGESSYPQREEAERHFQREAMLLGGFAHPHIVPVHDSGIDRGQRYLVMEYISGGSLAEAIRGRHRHRLALPAELPVVVDLIGQIAEALQYTHDHGVVHRDVKPGNILIQIEASGHWHLLLADFGLACEVGATPEDIGASGTLSYMAPEQLCGQAVPASDQYSLAILTFQLLTGVVPFSGDTEAIALGHLEGTPQHPSDLNPTVPYALGDVVLRGLAKHPEERYPSIAEFAEALRAAAISSEWSPDERERLNGAAHGEDDVVLVMGAPDVEDTLYLPAGISDAPNRPAIPAPMLTPLPAQLPSQLIAAGALFAPVASPYLALTQHGASWSREHAAHASHTGQTARRLSKTVSLTRSIVANPPQGLRMGVVLAACVALLFTLGLAGPGLLPTTTGQQTTAIGPISGSPGMSGVSGVARANGNGWPGVVTAAPTATSHKPNAQPDNTQPDNTQPDNTQSGATPLDQAQPSPQSLTVRVEPGQRFRVSFTFVNAGKTTWSSAQGYALTCAAARHPRATCLTLPHIGFGHYAVAPGGHFTFTVQLTAPSTTGTYPLWVSVGRNGGLFDGQDLLLQVKTLHAA